MAQNSRLRLPSFVVERKDKDGMLFSPKASVLVGVDGSLLSFFTRNHDSFGT